MRSFKTYYHRLEKRASRSPAWGLLTALFAASLLLTAFQPVFGQNSAKDWFQVGLNAAGPDSKIQAFEKVVQLDPNYIEAYYYLGLAYKSRGMLSEAEVALNKAYFKNPYALNKEIKTRILYELAGIYKELGKLDRARDAFIGARDLATNTRLKGQIHFSLGQIYLEESNVNAALDELRQAKRLMPDRARTIDELMAGAEQMKAVSDNYEGAVAAMRSGKYREAMSLFRQVIQIEPDFKDARAKLQEAERLLDQNQRSQRLASLYNDAQARIRANDRAGALRFLQQIVEIDANYRDASLLISDLRENRPERPATRPQPPADDAIERYYKQGRTALNRRNWEQAIAAFNRVISLDDSYKDVANLLAEAESGLQRQQRQTQQAEQLYQTGLNHLEEQNWRAALNAFQELKRLAGNYKDIANRITAARQGLAESRPQVSEIDSLYTRGLFALQNGEWHLAVQEFEKVRMLNDNYKDVQNKLADAQFNLNKRKHAALVQKKAGETNIVLLVGSTVSAVLVPLFGFLLLSPVSRARLLLLKGDYTKAARTHEKLLAKTPGKIKYLNRLAEIYLLAQRRDAKAMRVFETILKMNIQTKNREEINSIMANHYLAQQTTDASAIQTLERELNSKIRKLKSVA